MTPERAGQIVADHLQARFGEMLRIRAPERRRRAAGPTWSVPVVAVASYGEIAVAEVDVDDAGVMSPVLDNDRVITALRARPEAPSHDPLDSFSEADSLFAEIAADASGSEADVEASSIRLREIFRRSDAESLLEARKLLPHLLGVEDRRGRVLVMMAEVERRLGEARLAMGYLDAAAHELADRFDMVTLEKAAAMAVSIVGEAGFVDSPIRPLLHRCRARLSPLQDMFESPVLALIPAEHRALVREHARLTVLAPEEALVTEGEPSRALFVIKSGVLGIYHEHPARRLVRCCSPGKLLGESSVLVEDDPRCTATLCAEHVTEVWQLDAEMVRGLMRELPALRAKIAETRAVHGLDSFLSAHASVGSLDAQVRNEMLKCVQSIQSFPVRAVVIPAGAPPETPCLVARGQVSLHEGSDIHGAPVGVVGADEFLGVRDALHRISATRTVVAEAGSTLVFFNADALRSLADRSPEQAVLVLERLG